MQLITLARPAAILLAASSILGAQDQGNGLHPDSVLAREQYVRPPATIERLVLAPRHLNVSLGNQSPTRRHFLKTQSDGMPTAAQFGKPWYNLAALQIDPRANRARAMTTRAGTGLEIIDATTGRNTHVEVPAGATVSGPRWSPDGTQLAFFANFDDASHLYVADVATGKARRLAGPVLATLVTEPEWTANGTQIAAVFVPENRGPEPKEPAIATGPKVRMTKPGSKNRTPTFADLLEWPHERELLQHYTTGQLATVDVRTRAMRKVGSPAMIQRVDPSPKGGWFRIATLQKPFSYAVPVSSFGSVEEVWNADGRTVAVLSRRPLREGTRPGAGDDDAGAAATDTAKRNIEWLPGGEGIYFLQMDPSAAADTAQSQGAPARSRARDRLYRWDAPFDSSSRKAILDNAGRMTEVAFAENGTTLFVAENPTGVAHVFAVDLAEPTRRYTLTRVRGLQASLGVSRGGFGGGGGGGRGGAAADSVTFYENPGTLMSHRIAATPVITTSRDGRYAYLNGIQHYRTFNDSAPQPFLDRVEIRTGQKTRLFTSARDQFDQVTAALDPDLQQMVVTRESPTTIPDAYRRDAAGALTRLTSNRDYTPEITKAQKQMFQVTRPDGYKFWVTVTLPADYKAGTRLPGFLWFYPYEYTDQSGYDRTKRTFNRNRFPTLNALSKVYLVTQGYALIEPDAPVFGEQGRMNDNYVPDLRNNLAAIIDEVDRRELVDRQRIGLGGHSYGAFSTVNAMVHTPFFKAGIAGDGNYNRTLTPNTFQSERRDLWQARETYLSMSPMLYADRLTGALLMYHGLEDQNTGTDPINSIRLFHALQGMGKTSALYMYPYEDHGPATRETALDLWARWTAWLDKYVKGEKANGKIAN